MKAIAFLYVLTAGMGSAQTGAEYGWYWQNPLPQGNDLLAVTTLDTNTVVAVGWHAIVKTTDRGSTWKAVATPEYLMGVCFTDANHGIAVGSGIIRTSDGGATWTKASLPRSVQSLNRGALGDADHGLAVGYNGEILSTTDGGAT